MRWKRGELKWMNGQMLIVRVISSQFCSYNLHISMYSQHDQRWMKTMCCLFIGSSTLCFCVAVSLLHLMLRQMRIIFCVQCKWNGTLLAISLTFIWSSTEFIELHFLCRTINANQKRPNQRNNSRIIIKENMREIANGEREENSVSLRLCDVKFTRPTANKDQLRAHIKALFFMHWNEKVADEAMKKCWRWRRWRWCWKRRWR